MNDEIKEILDNFKCYEERYKKYNETQFIIIERDIHLLLDYITNLQHTEELNKADMQLMIQLEDYKSRCEKAIPMLKELHIKLKGILNTGIDIKEISDIEDTLNGRSDE